MKVLLINPPIEDFFFTPLRAYPLGILYLGTVLEANGFNVKLLNTLEENKRFSEVPPQDFQYLKRYYHPNKSPFCLFSHYHHFGLRYEKIEEKIRAFSPRIVGISSNFSPYFESALAVAQCVKRMDKNITVVFGGRFPTAQPEFVLSQPCVDFVIRGEAEYSLLELCRFAASKRIPDAKGLCYKTARGTHIAPAACIEDLNQLPFPRRELVQYQKYLYKGEISTSLLTSRGCNQGCGFCAINEKFRYRKAENVFAEIKACYALGIRHFNFEDDNINCNPEFERILDLITENALKTKISFMNGILSTGLSPRTRKKLINAGLTHLDFSLISAQNALRAKVQRKENTVRMFSIARAFTHAKIPVTVHFIVGLPGQTFNSSLKDIRLLAREPVLLGPSIFYPVIESPMFKELKEKFGSRESDYRHFRSSAACFDKSISRERIFSIFYFSRVINFLKEILDDFSFRPQDFFAYLLALERRYQFQGNAFITRERIDRVTLGLVLLDKLLKEYALFRVEERKEGTQFRYVFFQEEFVSACDIRRFFKSLTIQSISGTSLVFNGAFTIHRKRAHRFDAPF